MRLRRPLLLLLVPLLFGLGTITLAPLPARLSGWPRRPPSQDNAQRDAPPDRPPSAPLEGLAQRQRTARPPPKAVPAARPAGDGRPPPAMAGADPKVAEAFGKALQAYQRGIQRDEKSPEIEQSSAHFVDFKEPAGPGVELPVDLAHVDQRQLWRACDPTSTAYTPQTDRNCLAYLSNPHNVLYLKPMSAVLSFARTIKFRITYRHGSPPLQAIMKVAQKKFLFEPYAEVLGFAIDRILHINRVPPTAWLELPISWVQGAVTVMPPFYMQWLQLFVFDFPDVQPILRTGNAGIRYMNFSAQLWMADVHGAYETSLAPPNAYLHYLNGDRPITADVNESLAEISDLFVFDYIIGNTDRSLGKNNYVVGGCTRCPEPPAGQRHRGPPQYLHIDQGSAFYKRPGPAGSPLKDEPGRNATMCRFRRAVWERMERLRGGRDKDTLWGRMQRAVPPDVIRHVRPTRAKAAQDRMDHIVRHTEQRCFARQPRDVVLAFN